METHVKVLGILNVALGALGLCGALFLLLVFGGVAGAVLADGDPDAAAAISVIGLTGSALVIVLVALSLPGVIIGIGLYRRLPWARAAGIVLSILSLLLMPFGTVLGLYGLFVLFSKETEQIFAGQPATHV
jgi:hypothetical protein